MSYANNPRIRPLARAGLIVGSIGLVAAVTAVACGAAPMVFLATSLGVLGFLLCAMASLRHD